MPKTAVVRYGSLNKAETSRMNKLVAAVDTNDVKQARKVLSGMKRLKKACRIQVTTKPFWAAMQAGNVELARLFVEHPESKQNVINSTLFVGLNRLTALQVASTQKDVAMVQGLLKAGVDPNCTTGYEELTALHMACDVGSPEVVRALVNHYRTDVNARNLKNETPLCRAVKSGEHVEVVRALLNASTRIDVNAGNPLGHASTTEMIHLLLQRGSNPNIVHGSTTFMDAIRKRKASVVRAMWKFKDRIDLKARDQFGHTVLEIPTSDEIKEILRS